MTHSYIYIQIQTLFIFVLLALTFSIPTTSLQAAPPPVAASPCDPNYYSSMSSRAWLEAQREITQNQNLILKPDSVLEYTCFDEAVNLLSNEASNMFSTSIDLGDLVSDVVSDYLTANFDSDYLGERYSGSTPSTGAYNCSVMNDIWEQAKCFNFAADDATDGFYTFAEYRDYEDSGSSADRRSRPGSSTYECSSISSRWSSEIDAAFDEATTPWAEDNITTLFSALDPANCTDTSITTPIPTGITVRRDKQTPAEFEEHICLAPGCYYVPTGSSSGACQTAP